MKKPMNKAIAGLLVTLSCTWTQSFAGTVTLSRVWVDANKNRATIDATLIVDHAHKVPNPPPKDGDMHVAGRAQVAVGLPMVAEAMNAALPPQKSTVDLIHKVEGTNQGTPVTGAWRLWFEHPSASPQIQGDPVPPAGNTNPDHCFEIHPITKFGGNAVPNSFQFVVGGAPYDALTAFGSYEKLTISVTSSGTAVVLTSPKAGYNYTQFFLEAVGPVNDLDDSKEYEKDPNNKGGKGGVVLANVLEQKDGQLIAANIRMIFVPGTLPANYLKANPLHAGDQLHVWGIPRVNLEAIATFLNAPQSGTTTTSGKSTTSSKKKTSGTSAANRKLPYEMIIVGVEGITK
jgi:hypothetical protein